MWTPPDGWTATHGKDATVLVSPDGTGRIVLQEGLRPVGDHIDALVRALAIPGFMLDSAERAVTCEGERALIASGRAAGAPIELGFVLLDDTYARVIGHAAGDRAAFAAVVRRLVVSTRAFLGTPRRRGFWYVAPHGWTRTDTGSGDETWLAADYPKQRASITVARALPIAAREHVSMVRQLLEGAMLPSSTLASTHRRLTGSRWTRTITSDDGIELVVVVVALTDSTYDYFARAILPAAELAVFDELLETIEPVAPPPAIQYADTAVLSFWAS
jgi:hypothetical protein